MRVEDLFEMSEHIPMQGKAYNGEQEIEGSDYQEDDSVDFVEGGAATIGGASSTISGGVTKNLRTRK
jgi:hypothetical protein